MNSVTCNTLMEINMGGAKGMGKRKKERKGKETKPYAQKRKTYKHSGKEI